MSNDESELT